MREFSLVSRPRVGSRGPPPPPGTAARRRTLAAAAGAASVPIARGGGPRQSPAARPVAPRRRRQRPTGPAAPCRASAGRETPHRGPQRATEGPQADRVRLRPGKRPTAAHRGGGRAVARIPCRPGAAPQALRVITREGIPRGGIRLIKNSRKGESLMKI